MATPASSSRRTHERPDEGRPIYLDYAATTPVDPRVAEEVMHFMLEEFGNAGSRTHSYGQAAKERVNRARAEVAAVVDAKPDEVIFTSGATESNNLAILGLAPHGEKSGKKHIVSTQIEHKAVLEPLAELERRGFEVDLVPPTRGGWVDADEVVARVRDDTLLVSVMAVNNETGVIQPTDEVAGALTAGGAYFHVDAAQAFGKLVGPLRNSRIDLVSMSGHKIGAPKGIGALIARRRRFSRPPLAPLMVGGGQERGLRPGTLPVPLVAGLGLASALAVEFGEERQTLLRDVRREFSSRLHGIGAQSNADESRAMPGILNVYVPGIDSEAAIVALKGVAAISNGSACTSQSYDSSHVLTAAGATTAEIEGALRFSFDETLSAKAMDAIVKRLRVMKTAPA
ncbi:aminotransferase class V-fold PLP-dependent enzyme [Demequina rhizosphaerae]|uniref:aminotransferase class V-fold PLP-dependent enzyme n=1 Tax=Demequina rhizosphaerae TaxID=1638985 RepID=UPI0009E53F3E|nr:aminotransferase class V-fold PLP-dependent enzyme [Demequina rhizosphaerae]